MKGIIAIVILLVSFNAYSCKPANSLGGHAFFLKGVLSKLQETDVFADFEILNIKKISSDYMVRVFNSNNEECIDVLLQPYGTGSCDSMTADIINMTPVNSNSCFRE